MSPREELNRRALDVLAEIKTREEGRRKNKLAFNLLPKLYQPIVVPGIHDLKFDATVGCSLPSYVDPRETVPQPDLARLYAQYGDLEAGRKLARGQEPADLEKLKLEKNYPVEWTRYVAYHLHALGQKIALGDTEALAEFLDARKQLETALGEKDRTSPLGQALLARERRVIQQAADALRKQGQTALANQASGALGNWPDAPPPLPLDEGREFWCRALRAPADSKVVAGIPALRALDFLQLPYPAEALDAVFLFFSEQGQLEEVLIGYTARVQDQYPRAAELAGALSDFVPSDSEATASKSNQICQGWTVETRVTPIDSTVGAWVRWSRQRPVAPVAVPRDFGPIHLDWSFESTRLQLAPNVLGNPVVLKDDAALDRFPNPLSVGKLLDVTLVQTPDHNLLQEASFRYRPGTPWHQLAQPLFAQLGLGKWSVEDAGSNHGPRVRITWEDDASQLTFSIPHESREPSELEYRDRRDSSHHAARVAAVKARESKERQERLASGKAAQRLPRKLDYLPLGGERDDVVRYLPKGQTVLKREFDGGMLVVVNSPPPKDGPPYMARQLLLRFGKDDKLAWARVRYDIAVKPKNAKEGDWPRQILDLWRKPGGAVGALASPYAARMSDLPPQNPPGVLYRWEDDLTEAAFLSDRNGVEVTLEDRPLSGEDLPPLTYLPRGPSEGATGVTLGMDRKDFEAIAKSKPIESPDGAWVFGIPQGLYDAVLVWFDKDNKARQITARFRQADASKTGQKDLEKFLSDRWGAEVKQVGWPARRDYSPQGSLQSLVWFDDVTRYRLYWADSDNSPSRLWAEWKAEK
jgi:hypothetical protein